MATILIVDDRPTNRQFLVTLLGYSGHRLLEAADGAQALGLVLEQHPDLVITDLLMPTMDGFEFVQHLRADPELKETKVIFYTATYRTHEARLLAKACGVEYVLAKPTEPKTILETVQRALGSSGGEVTPSIPTTDERIGVMRLRQISEEMVTYFTELQTASTQLYNTIERGAVLAAERDYLLDVAAKFSAVVGELQGLNNRLSVLNELASDFMSERDPDRLLQLFCDAARKVTQARYAATVLLEPDEQTLSRHVFSGIDPETIAKIGAPAIHRGLLKQVIDERRVVRMRDIPADPNSTGFPPHHPPMTSFMGVPVFIRTRLYGMFYVADRLGMPGFSEEDERIGLALASPMAAAYENLSLYNQVQSHAASLQIEVNERRKAEEALQAKNQEIKIMSQQLWQAAKLATMGELAASIAHELNNPLATVSLRTEMLLTRHSSDSPESRSLLIIDSEVKRMSALVANLLQYSRRSPRQLSTVDVRKEITGTLELVHHHFQKHNIQTVLEFSPVALMIQADRQQLQQVFLNLFTNAADAMPQGGTLTIRIGPNEQPASGGTAPLRRSTTASLGLPVSDLPRVFIEVSDTGEGIPPENLDRVWDPFYTTKPEGKGTGLGLAICRRIVEEHGGTIEISSEGIPGTGTVVRVTLPAPTGDNEHVTDL